MKRLLLLNGSFNEVHLIHAAHRLGYYVITTGNDPSGEGHKYSNEYCPCDYSDLEAVYRLAKEKAVDRICACSNDFGALSAAYACEKLGLPGHDSYETSRVFHEKDRFRKTAVKLHLSVPNAVSFDDEEMAIRYMDGMAQTVFPLIIKPADLSGGKGISTVYDRKNGRKAIRLAFSRSKIKRIVIEEYITGQQQGVTVFLRSGKVAFDYSTNDYAYVNPFMVWMSYGSPADHYSEYRERLIRDIETLARETQATDGFLTIQYMLRDGVPYYLESMRRCLGNQHYLCMSRDMGIDFFELYILAECGEDCSDYLRRFRCADIKSGFMALFAPQYGIIERIKVDPRLQKKLFDVKMLKGPGERVSDYLSDKLGMLYFSLNEEDISWFLQNKKTLFRVDIRQDGTEVIGP